MIVPTHQSDHDVTSDNLLECTDIVNGDLAVLEFTFANGNTMQLILNSLLSYTSKCLSDN